MNAMSFTMLVSVRLNPVESPYPVRKQRHSEASTYRGLQRRFPSLHRSPALDKTHRSPALDKTLRIILLKFSNYFRIATNSFSSLGKIQSLQGFGGPGGQRRNNLADAKKAFVDVDSFLEGTALTAGLFNAFGTCQIY
ncbi:hypothetical protein HUJ04_003402 [Dendroctonus ponderosae]|nr:hypothetical protein HUJ04_003402 [Dendroctonus ponderosae]